MIKCINTIALLLMSSAVAKGDVVTPLNPSTFREFMSQTQDAKLHVRHRSYCGEDETCFDVAPGSIPKGFDHCWITVSKSSRSHATEYCLVYTGTSRATADQVWEQSKQVVKRELTSWTYSYPSLPSDAYLGKLQILDPTNNDHEIYMSYMFINDQYRIAISSRVTNAKIPQST